ncbi:MAG: hypothetical protein LBI54_02655 [Lachnospiraceae bacterium]|nr:hypothetical protein [Lachnospiraceae bacterium]
MKILILLFLVLCTYFDLKSLRVPLALVAGFGVACGGLCLWSGGFAGGEFLLRLLPGVVFLLLAFLTREAVGYGDGAVLLPVCLLLKMPVIMAFIMLALAFCALFSLVLVMLKKGGKETRLPFMPFLLAAWGVIIIWW